MAYGSLHADFNDAYYKRFKLTTREQKMFHHQAVAGDSGFDNYSPHREAAKYWEARIKDLDENDESNAEDPRFYPGEDIRSI